MTFYALAALAPGALALVGGLTGLETFLAVVQTGSMAAAAKQVFVSQGTAFTRIKALEEELGVTLFERARGVHGITLTPLGEQLLPKRALPWVGSAVDVLMQSVLNVVDADENLTRLHS